MSDIDHIRQEYALRGLNRSELAESPIQMFDQWFGDALAAKVPEPNAMTLSTVRGSGRPSSRIVLLKGVDVRGFSFFTNYNSGKGKELEALPFAALTFFWPAMERQVRVEGRVEKVSRDESLEYFSKRPRGAQVGAWASDQSSVVPDREHLDARMKEFEERFDEGGVPLPDHWGGYRVVPDLVEFWQGRPNRLHDRFRFTLEKANDWKIERLSP